MKPDQQRRRSLRRFAAKAAAHLGFGAMSGTGAGGSLWEFFEHFLD